ncbi:cobalt-precorrin-6A reductase [Streptomyces violaceoruber]|uniref:Precorrin-6X reductase n=7 Tax=Streptomyces TaxID=1883 RepID=Q9X8F6_STRCO|nr:MULTISPECIES: cobalt-precorrin-6A reductase [Streptomyces]MYU42806.1 cobalt-precorrin-6A reductase [Streptomyces sp. SID7813]QSJ10778.1 cobalt-precorrin-6x reductase [Streptomyces lividans]AIJ15213.1 cobalt-precorrin-6x reductase [Streptomyces lividans TK24]EFD68635.1 precorrin-6x reductase [Streptomyces lividans TK24]EOY48340.1 Cobalt-precorrin-6x reductase [Streptomyces lividans 1326]
MHVLILGGTTEARRLAELLAAGQPAGPRVTTSLAGRVSAPRTPPGEVRVGGFGGAEGLAAWLREHAVGLLVDATHPFAGTITRNAAHAAATAGVPLLVLRRPGWRPVEGDVWHEAGSLAEAAALLPALGRRVFLTTGRTGLAVFAPLADPWFLVRSVDAPEGPRPPRTEVLLDRGPFTLDGERELLRRHRIDVLVTKDSGGAATAPKLTAAREAGLPVVVVRRPPVPEGVRVVAEPGQAARWVAEARARRSPRRP